MQQSSGAEEDDQLREAQAYNSSIYLMVGMPYLMLGAFGFGVMLVSAIIFTQNARKMGRAGLQELTQSMRARGLGELLGDTRKRLRDRFKRDE